MKIMMHTVNGEGLGHLNRTVTIAKSLKELDTSIEILFITNSRFTRMISDAGFRYVKLPHLTMEKLVNKEIRRIFMDTVESFDPDIIVYDTHFPSDFVTYADRKGIANILVLRKFRNKLFSRYIRKMEESGSVFSKFQKIILPHTRQDFLSFGVSSSTMVRILSNSKYVFSGPVIKKPSIEKRKKIRLKYGIDNKTFTVIAVCGAGGGEEQAEEIGRYLNFVEKISGKLHESIPNLKFIVVKGPFNRRKIGDNQMLVVDYEENLMELMTVSDIIISTGGYNSINEISASGKPSIIFPLRKTHDDQKERASILGKNIMICESPEDSGLAVRKILDFVKSSEDKVTGIGPVRNSLKNNIAREIVNTGLTIRLSNRCNNRCGFCRFDRGAVSTNEIKRQIKKFRLRKSLIISGGEPMLPDKIFDVIRYANSLGYEEIKIKTNARLASYPDYCRKLVALGIKKFVICYLGDDEAVHDTITKTCSSFSQTREGMINLSEAGGEVEILYDGSYCNQLNNITFNITNNCNLRCKMCDIWKSQKKSELPKEKIFEILNTISRLDSISITGGEPFLNGDLNEIYDAIRACFPKIGVDISTNGTQKYRILDFLNNVGTTNNLTLIFSIDGIEKHDYQRGVSGSYSKTTGTIETVKQYFPNIRLIIKMTITPWNYDEIYKVYNLSQKMETEFELKPVDCDKNYTNTLNPDVEFRFSEEIIREIEKQIHKIVSESPNNNTLLKMIPQFLRDKRKLEINCRCPESSALIMPNGDVYTCLQYENIGNVNKKGFDDIWNSTKHVKIIEKAGKRCPKCLSYYGSVWSLGE